MTTLTGRAKAWLRRRGLEVAVPQTRTPRSVVHARLTRFQLPAVDGLSSDCADPTVRVVDLGRMVNRAGFGFGGWHPMVAAALERLEEPSLPYEQTSLARFYASFQPSTLAGLLLAPDDGDTGPALRRWPAVDRILDPWSVSAADVARERARHASTRPLPHSQYRGPVEPRFGAHHLQRVLDVATSVREIGYRPATPRDHVTGYFLTRGEDYRFVVGHGNHRVAALAALGHTEVPVRLRQGHPPVVDHDRLRRWTRARGGLHTPEDAQALFDAFFVDSACRARRLGLC